MPPQAQRLAVNPLAQHQRLTPPLQPGPQLLAERREVRLHPADGQRRSVFKAGPSITIQQNPAGSILKSNVWARTAEQTAVKVAACARFCPSNAATEGAPSASGCTAEHVLP